ncbi:MAG: MscS Mechanosensitive ion channel [Pedosphaera sp.]|nr:MscS Mechanosensitive ion channel [Pedosphaera sp.]
MAFPTTLPTVASVAGALPTLSAMLIQGAFNVVVAILILIAGWVLARWMGRWVRELMGTTHYIDVTLKPLIASFARYVVLTLTIVVVLGQFGVQTASLIALLGAAGLAVGLALQGTLSNVASGVMLLLLRPFRIYDKIKLTDVTGTVREIGLFRTEVVTDNGNFVSIPNATIFSGTIINTSRESTRRTDFTVEVDRSEDLDEIEKKLMECLTLDKRVLKSPAPTVEVESLGPLSTVLTVQVWLENRDFGSALSNVKKKVRHTLQGANISAPLPVPAPAVAPWQPSEKSGESRPAKPN